jgi:hypothetical protein
MFVRSSVSYLLFNGHGGYCHHGIHQTYQNLNHCDVIRHLNVNRLGSFAPLLVECMEHLMALEHR